MAKAFAGGIVFVYVAIRSQAGVPLRKIAAYLEAARPNIDLRGRPLITVTVRSVQGLLYANFESYCELSYLPSCHSAHRACSKVIKNCNHLRRHTLTKQSARQASYLQHVDQA